MKLKRSILIVITIINNSFAADSTKQKSFLDNLQNWFELRQSFDSKSETNKPAILTYEKKEGDEAVSTIDAALMYEGFQYNRFGISPLVQLEYTSTGSSREETFKTGLVGFFEFYKYSGGSGRLEPSIYYSKDFLSEIQIASGSLIFAPSFPYFFLPIRKVSSVKFNYDGNDNKWIFGFVPTAGLYYEKELGDINDGKERLWYSKLTANLTAKRYYIQLDLSAKYEQEFEESEQKFYKYEATLTIYFDDKERSSFNAKLEKDVSPKKDFYKIKFGFGLEL